MLSSDHEEDAAAAETSDSLASPLGSEASLPKPLAPSESEPGTAASLRGVRSRLRCLCRACLNVNVILRWTGVRYRGQYLLKPRTENTFLHIFWSLFRPERARCFGVLALISVSPLHDLVLAIETGDELKISRACAELVIPVQFVLGVVYFAHNHLSVFYVDASLTEAGNEAGDAARLTPAAARETTQSSNTSAGASGVANTTLQRISRGPCAPPLYPASAAAATSAPPTVLRTSAARPPPPHAARAAAVSTPPAVTRGAAAAPIVPDTEAFRSAHGLPPVPAPRDTDVDSAAPPPVAAVCSTDSSWTPPPMPRPPLAEPPKIGGVSIRHRRRRQGGARNHRLHSRRVSEAEAKEMAIGMISRTFCTLKPMQVVCLCVHVVTVADLIVNIIGRIVDDVNVSRMYWKLPFWLISHTVGTTVYHTNVAVFAFVLTRHVRIIELYSDILAEQKWDRASEWRASTILLNVINMKYALYTSSKLLGFIFSAATLLHTVMAVSFYYASSAEKYNIENISNLSFFAFIQGIFAIAILRVSNAKSSISELVHSPAFANRFVRRHRNPTREQIASDSARMSDWGTLRKILVEPWIEFSVLSLPVHDFSFIKKVFAGAVALITLLNVRESSTCA